MRPLDLHFTRDGDHLDLAGQHRPEDRDRSAYTRDIDLDNGKEEGNRTVPSWIKCWVGTGPVLNNTGNTPDRDRNDAECLIRPKQNAGIRE